MTPLKNTSLEREEVGIWPEVPTPLQLDEAVSVLGFPTTGAHDNGVNFTNGLVSPVAGMDNDTTEFQMTAAVQPGNSSGPVLDGSGALLGV